MEENGRTGGVIPSFTSELGTEYPFDVLKEDTLGSHDSEAILDVGEEMAGVCVSTSLTSGTEWLTREPSRQDIHQSVKTGEREGPQIRPYRSDIQEGGLAFPNASFHLRNQVGDGKGFDLRSSDCEETSDNVTKSEANAFIAGAEADVMS